MSIKMTSPAAGGRPNMVAGFGAFLTLLVILMAIAGLEFQRLNSSIRIRSHTYRVLLAASDLELDLFDIRALSRSYALSRDKDGPAKIKAAQAKFVAAINAIRALVVDSPDQEQRLTLVASEELKWEKDFVLPMIDLGSGQVPTGRVLDLLTARYQIGDEDLTVVQKTVESIKAEEAGLLASRSERIAWAREWTVVTLGVCGLLAFGLSLSLFRTLGKNFNVLQEVNRNLEDEIFERKQVETDLKTLARQLETASKNNQQILDFSIDVICTIDAEGKFSQVSSASTEVFGYSPQELIGRPFIDLVHPDDIERTMAADGAIRTGSSTRNFENRYVRKDGSYVPISWSAAWSNTERTTFCVARDNSVGKAAEELILRAREEAEHANSAKSELLSRMSHELRTPLNAILGFAQLMAMEDPTPVQSESIDQILRGGRHLLDLINEVLDISRIEAGRLLISPEPVLVSEVVQEAMDMVKPLADERRIQFRQELECRRFVQADRQRIKQVFLNLLTNAVKYNREGGTVKVCCKVEESGFLLIDFCDTGLGIAPDDIRRLFTAFERLGANQSTIEGTGLGLTLSRGLVEAMGGKLDAQSQVGEGTTLTVRLPLAEGQVERLERTNGKEINGVPVKLADNTRTVLYIEDNLSNLRLIERILGRQPEIRLHSALLGKLGIELAQLHRPDLILLDLHLPDINGDEVLKRLQADPNTRTIPVVMLTADASAGQIKRLLDAGAAEYLTKPLDVARFLQVLQKNLS